MTRVYAIHTGAYSDQVWGPVFGTVKKAQEYQAALKDPESDIEVHVLDDETDTGKVYPVWIIVFNAEGDVISSYQDEDASPYEPLLHHPEVLVPPKNNHWYFLNEPGVRAAAVLVVQNVRACDLKHAVKIAADNRRQFLARGAKP